LSPQTSLDERIASTRFAAGISRALSLRVDHFGRKSETLYRARVGTVYEEFIRAVPREGWLKSALRKQGEALYPYSTSEVAVG
jgi:hypothetical protein